MKRSRMAELRARVGPDDLQRDRAVQFAVFGFVDRSHAALAEHRENFVAPGQNCAVFEEVFVFGLRRTDRSGGRRTLMHGGRIRA